MGFKSVFSHVAEFLAPVAEAAFPPAAPILQMAAGALSRGTGKPVAATQSTITQAMTNLMASPEDIANLKKIDDDFAAQLKNFDLQDAESFRNWLAEMASDDEADRASARAMQASTRSIIAPLLAVGITLGFFGTLWFVFVHGVTPDTHDLAIGMVNVLGTAWVCVVGFYFGGSHGQEKITQLLANSTNGNGAH